MCHQNAGRDSNLCWCQQLLLIASHVINILLCYRKEDILLRSFAAFDADKDGLISEQDLANVTHQEGLQCDLIDINRMIQEHDSNRDGKIDFQEVRCLTPPRYEWGGSTCICRVTGNCEQFGYMTLQLGQQSL